MSFQCSDGRARLRIPECNAEVIASRDETFSVREKRNGPYRSSARENGELTARLDRPNPGAVGKAAGKQELPIRRESHCADLLRVPHEFSDQFPGRSVPKPCNAILCSRRQEFAVRRESN